jgi:hypothetical protein
MAKKFLTTIDLNNNGIINLRDPVNPQDAANKRYVDALVEGLDWKEAVKVATTANVNINSPGATIDGVTLSTGDRVLLMGQTDPKQNGIYVFNGASNPLTRAPDANTGSELTGAVVIVLEGSYAGTTWRQVTVNPVIGTDNIVWQQFGSSAPPASESSPGIIRIATQAEVDAGTVDNAAVTPLKLAQSILRLKKYATLIGDGSATTYTVTHGLNTRDVVVQLYDAATYETVEADVVRNGVDTVQITFGSPPATNSIRVVVIG